MQHLQQNSTLQRGKYKIISILGQGGFGITYLAEQVMLGRKVALKEFFFREYCDRDENTSHITLGTQSSAETVQKFLQKFLKEARTISQLEHPNIIKIHDIFEENNTAYYVMDYIEGESLSDIVKREGALPEVTVVEYVKEVASALSYIHSKSINHLDVKPANIMLKKSDNQVVLIDFGLSKQYDEIGSQTSSTPVGISQGYAPIEQYRAGGVSTFSPQTDIYSLGATLYWLVIGKTPPAADEILDEGLPTLPKSISETVKNAITSAMQARKKDRPESVEKWLEILVAKKESKKKATAKKATAKPTAPKAEPTVDESTMLITPSKPKTLPKKKEVVSVPSFNLNEYRINPILLKNVKDTENKANLGNTECMFAIAVMYLRGEGKFQNFDQANKWFLKSKEKGDKRAEVILTDWKNIVTMAIAKKTEEEITELEAQRKAYEAELLKMNEEDEDKVETHTQKAMKNNNWIGVAVGIIVAVCGMIGIINKPSGSVNNKLEDTTKETIHHEVSYRTFTINGVLLKMISVDGGYALPEMGSQTDPVDESCDTAMIEVISIDSVAYINSFYIGETEVTQELWIAVMGNNPSEFKGDNLPVECVSWNDCQQFISKLNSMTGENFRLPTEAEWEFAARGGNYSNHYHYSGSNNIDAVAWYGGKSTHAVATKQPNELGIYDMSGNIIELCSDYNPTGYIGIDRVGRGGDFFNVAGNCRLSTRFYCSSGGTYPTTGFRLALSL